VVAVPVDALSRTGGERTSGLTRRCPAIATLVACAGGIRAQLRKRSERKDREEMAAIEMKVRRMQTGETLVATLETFEDAVTWLGERPEFTEVLGVLSKELSPAQHRALRAAMRPYSAAERRHLEAEERVIAEALAERDRVEAELAERQRREHEAAMRRADPDRPMALRWHYVDGLSHEDPFDPRPVTEAARRAVEAWIAERNEWVASREQTVYEALVTVYPGPVPTGDEADRVQPGGQFVPGPAQRH
jgi:hypothetical protein